ncbi:MAG: hypothetical protein JW981_07480, partial [Anaerolineae bacterium]|nr:hypothetical protein [Anaerolineae bacterium]
DAGGSQILSRAREEVNVPATGTEKIRIDMPPVTLQAGQTLYLIIECPLGEPVMFETSVIANEHWDDGLPLRIDGKDPFSSWYRGLTTTTDGLLHLYDEDTLDKRENLLNWLDETDYIVMSSNRLYGSIPRLPMRYPMTIAYYEALFDGRLGFELLADFSSFPRLGDCQFPDQEIPFELTEPRFTNAAPCSVSYPPAEEAFSVYDHPRVLIFGKTAAYSRENVKALLPPSLLDNVQWMTPLQATRNSSAAAKTLLMDEELRSVQESGGTWSELFNRKALQNRYPILAVVLWWLLLTALGLLAFPWLYIGLPNLKDKGYGLARAAGLLLWAYPAWLLAALRLAPHTRLLLWGIFLLFLCVSGLLAYRRKDELLAYRRENWRNLLTIDIIFTILYLAWTYIRYLNPDLWHPVIGGEKPMDFAYLNAVIKSTWFPPYDPWFSGGIMNYYYFGFVLIGSLTKALGIMPSIAYNLAIPSLFAMTGVGAYSLAQNLSGQSGKRARRAGLWGLLLVLLLGNLGELRLIFKGLEELGDVHIESFIPGYPALVSALVGFWKVLVEGQNLLFRPEWWYWDATRVIPYDPGDAGPINEFPLFTFIYADLHAHMMAFPLTQVALGVALQWGLRENKLVKQLLVTPARSLWSYLKSIKPANVVTFFLGALAAGSLRATNTWDYPTYFGLIAVSFILAFFNTLKIAPRSGEEKPWQIYAHLLIPVLMLLTAEVLFRPYTANYATVYGQFSPWKGMKTPLGIYLIMHAQFVVPLLILAVLQSGVILRDLWQQRDINTWLSLGIIGLGMAILMATLLWLGVSIAWLVVPLGTIAALIVLDVGTPVQTRILWFWVGTALFLSLLVEVVVLSGDIGRMNTVFKFYLQVWMLLALAAAVAFERIFTYCFAKEDTPTDSLADDALWRIFKSLPYSLTDTVLVILSTLLFATALYTFLAIPARVQDRWNPGVPHTLDGAAFIPYNTQYENGGMAPLYEDYRVIKWFQDNVEGNPIIMEAQAEREYLWGNRISIYTGLPSVAAWRWHQVQQRMVMEAGVVERRQFDIKGFYNSAEPAYAYQLLLRNAVDYVVLTSYERLYMLPEGEPKFADMVANGWLEVAYHEGDAFVYKVIK